MKCEDCVFKNSFPEDVDYCIALSKFIDDVDDPPCEGSKHILRDEDKPRHKQLLAAVKNLREEMK